MANQAIFFGAQSSDKSLEMILWARDNGIPALYSFTTGSDSIRRYRGSKWMIRNYSPELDKFGRPKGRPKGGHIILRECDTHFWILRWGLRDFEIFAFSF